MDVFGFVQAKLRKALQKVFAKNAIGVFLYEIGIESRSPSAHFCHEP